MVSAWLCQRTTHLYWGEGSKGSPIHATSGVDQGCPLSPALFAIGLAASLERIQDKLAALSPDCRVFSYLDDVMVVIPSDQAERAMGVVIAELEGAGLTVNAGKTSSWTRDPTVVLPPAVQALRTDKLEVLGATAPWLDREGDFSHIGVHNLADGAQVVQSARTFVTKLNELHKAGLSPKAFFVLLRSFSQGHVTHLLRANYEASDWTRQFDDALVSGLESLVGATLDEGRRAQCFLRLADGGLGFGSAELARESAYLGSWALTLKDVAASVGATSWEGFRAKCGSLAASP
jgi:hypothetical protein